MRLELRCPGTFTLNLERWSDCSEEFVYLSCVCGRVWPLFQEIVWACFDRFFRLAGLAVGGFESLPLYAAFIYMIDILFRIFLSRFQVNLSCRSYLIPMRRSICRFVRDFS